jgi:hypothetical protein
MIDGASQATIRSFQSHAPVDVVAMADAFGINVWEDMLNGVSGKLFRDAENGGASGYSIVVNSSEPPTRKRFTVAHEIAHFLLHRNQVGSGGVEDDVYYRSKLSNALEAQANRLAADMIMPYRLIRSLQEEGCVEVPNLAQRLQVSSVALKIRLGIPVVD